MQDAPYFADVAEGPEGGSAHWLKADDGVQLRAVYWPQDRARGTVLLFPGRTEYCEKYGRTALGLAEQGLATLAIDWRGQGLSDRLAEDRMLGHVGKFSDYQLDVNALVAHARALGAPEPYFLLGHSMGGCIGLRALYNDVPVEAAAFSAPMWGIFISAMLRPVAWGLSNASNVLGFSEAYAPGSKPDTYVLSDPFEDNTLTTFEDMWDYMVRQAKAHPELTLGGPSLHWLSEALRETHEMHKMASPARRAITFLGTNERIVDVLRVKTRMERWGSGVLVMKDGLEHEVLMEAPEIRNTIHREMAEFFFPDPVG